MALTPLTDLPQRTEAAKRLPLPENSPFLIYVDPLCVRLLDGEFHYLPIEVPFAPGRQGVTDKDTGPMKTYQEDKLKRTLVPMNFEVIAWDEKVNGYMVAKDIGRDRAGKQLTHYHNVWTRYVEIGNSLQPEFDHDGWDDFCKRCTELMGGPPHQRVSDMERRRLQRQAESHRRLGAKVPGSDARAERIEKAITSTKTTTKGAGRARKK
jgi:hypothetical protein